MAQPSRRDRRALPTQRQRLPSRCRYRPDATRLGFLRRQHGSEVVARGAGQDEDLSTPTTPR